MPRAFDVMILHLSQDNKLSSCGLWMFQISTLANCETEVFKLFDSSGDKHDEKISNCSSTPKLTQAHDSAMSLTIFLLFS